MTTFISWSLVTLSLISVIPVAVFFVEVVAAVVRPPPDCSLQHDKHCRQRVAVLVPAHNESTNLLPTLADIKAQIHSVDRLVVVADNCSDDTAALAAAAGVEVVERNDPDKKGKGYALAWGLRHLGANPPDIVIMVDADCRLAVSAINRLTELCAATHRPVQALYLMTSPEKSPINYQVAEFALRVKNWVRPLGCRALGLPCQLMGSGMAFPWDVICLVDLASGCIVEDYKLGLDLTLAGNPPLFCPSAAVTSYFPPSDKGAGHQRLRWEQGHIEMILAAAPRLIHAAIVRRNLRLLALVFDLAVPPLSLLGILLMGLFTAAGLAALLGVSSTAMFVSSASLVGLIGGAVISWLKYGRDILPPRSIILIPSYVFGKLPLYRKILSRKSGSEWIRADRRRIS